HTRSKRDWSSDVCSSDLASTEAVRRVLPSDIPHMDARFNVSRTGVLLVALSKDPSLLWEGTRDRMHQPFRAEVLPISSEWVNRQIGRASCRERVEIGVVA